LDLDKQVSKQVYRDVKRRMEVRSDSTPSTLQQLVKII
jgi:hypothetical protein